MHLSLPVPYAAVRSKAVVLLLLIYCLLHFPLFHGGSFSGFAMILKRKRKLCYYCLTDVLFYKCSVALPHGAVGWSAVCDCGIS